MLRLTLSKDVAMPAAQAVGAAVFRPVATQFRHVHLFKNDIVPDRNSALVDFEEADFGGYALAVLPDSTGVTTRDPSSRNLICSSPEPEDGVIFTADNTIAGPQTIYGAYVTDKTNAALVGAVRFDEPVVIEEEGDAVVLEDLVVEFDADFSLLQE